MKLRLHDPPDAAHMPLHAARIVESAKRISGADLDYSVASLSVVDDILENFRAEGVSSSEVAETLFGFGAYVGEVIVRTAEGRWVDPAPNLPLGGAWPVVELSGHMLNPVAKAFKRVDNGSVDSIPYFYEAFVGR